MKALKLALGAVVLTASCKVGPDYETPPPLPNDQPITDEWHTAATMGLDTNASDIQAWWTVFRDPKLEEVLRRAQLSNLDLQAAVARIVEARAFVIQRLEDGAVLLARDATQLAFDPGQLDSGFLVPLTALLAVALRATEGRAQGQGEASVLHPQIRVQQGKPEESEQAGGEADPKAAAARYARGA